MTKNSRVLKPTARARERERTDSGGICRGLRTRMRTQLKRSKIRMLPRKSTPMQKRRIRSLPISRRRPGPRWKPKMVFSTRRSEAKSWLAKSSSTAVPSSPLRLRRRMIWPRASWSSPLYTGMISESWLRTSSEAVRRLRTNPARATMKKRMGTRQVRKLKARPAAAKNPRWARKFATAVRRTLIPSLHHALDQATVYLHHAARDVGGALGAEEHHHVRELLGATDAPHGNVGRGAGGHPLLEGLPRPRGQVLLVADEAIGLDAAGQDHVHGDAVLGEVVGERLEHARDARPDPVREDQSLHGLLHRARLDSEDAPPLFLLHVGQHGADEAHSGEVHLLESRRPVLVRHLLERAGGRAPDVGHEDVDAAPLLPRLRDDALDVLRLVGVGGHGEHLGPRARPHLIGGGLEIRLSAGAHAHAGALA